MKYRGVKIPKLNGRPQLWSRGTKADGDTAGLRIIYPNGNVQYCVDYECDLFGERPVPIFMYGCTTRKRQLAAIKASIEYSIALGVEAEFLGYL